MPRFRSGPGPATRVSGDGRMCAAANEAVGRREPVPSKVEPEKGGAGDLEMKTTMTMRAEWKGRSGGELWALTAKACEAAPAGRSNGAERKGEAAPPGQVGGQGGEAM